jgi:hypothetical protein
MLGAAVLVLQIALGASQPQSSPPQPHGFTSIINPGGWAIPKHGKVVKPKPTDWPGVPPGITFTEFALDPNTTLLDHAIPV